MLNIANQSLSEKSEKKAYQKLILSRRLAENILVFLLQYIGLMFSGLTPLPSPLWTASGTALAFTFLRGFSVLPGIAVGSFLAYYLATQAFFLSATCATLLMLQAYLLVTFSYRYVSPTLLFFHRLIFLKFILLSCSLTALCSLALLIVCYPLLPSPPPSFFGYWLQWWLANFNGLFIIASALITLDAYYPEIEALKNIHKPTFIFLFSVLLLLITLIILNQNPLVTTSAALLTLPLLSAISLRLSKPGAVSALFLLGFLLTLATSMTAPLKNILFIQCLLAIEIIMSLGLTAELPRDIQ